MKKLLSVLLVMSVILSQTIVLAGAENLSDGITKTQSKYKDYITEAISKSEFEEKQIDKDNVFIVELTNPMAIKNNTSPLIIYVALPIIDTEDISYAGFEKNKYVTAITNFSSLASVENPYGNKLKQYLEDNNLSEPTEIKILQIIERLHLFVYYVVCDNTEYIIPYHFTDESNFNITNSDECNLEYGKAYTVNEFNSVCDKEQVLFEKERKKRAESENGDKTHIDNDGEVVEQKAETNKTDSVKEDGETDDKAEQKDTDEETFTFDELTKISTKQIEKISIACSKNGRTEFATSSPLIISNVVNSVKNMQYEKDITAGSGAGGWLYFINFYLEDDTYIQFGTRLYIDKINYIGLEHETAIDIMSYYHDLIGSIDSSEWTTDSKAASELKIYGIMNGDENGAMNLKDAITRAEAMALIVRLYKLYNKEITSKKNGFTDMEGHWAYDEISYAKSAGLIDGTSETTFEPERNVTVQEFAKMIVSLLGYSEMAEAQGGYPNGYVMCADSLGLLTEITAQTTETALRGDVAIMLAIALDIPVMLETIDENGETYYTVMNGENGIEHQSFRTMIEAK